MKLLSPARLSDQTLARARLPKSARRVRLLETFAAALAPLPTVSDCSAVTLRPPTSIDRNRGNGHPPGQMVRNGRVLVSSIQMLHQLTGMPE